MLSARAKPLAALALGMATALPAAAQTWVVDDDGAQCPGAGFTAIQPAVDAAAAGDTVQVCAGDYPAPVRIAKSLRLHGPQVGVDGRLRVLGGPGEAVIRAPRPLTISTGRVVVDGLSIVVQLDDEGEGRGIGVAGTGHRIQNNLFEDDGVSGIILDNVTGERTVTIRRNQFRGRFGIAADSESVAHNVAIVGNLFVNASILFVNGGHSGLRIEGNRLRYDPDATTVCLTRPHVQCRPVIALGSTVDAIVRGNTISGSGVHALNLEDNLALQVVDNELRRGRGIGIRVAGTATEVAILGNRVRDFRLDGIRLDGASSALVEGNALAGNRVGLALAGGGANRITANVVETSSVFGIDVQDSAGNAIDRNAASGSGRRDCRDTTTGAGTAGTANTWVANTGATSAPAGLCSP